MSEFNILFTSAGRRVSLLRCFRNALNELDLKGRLITADVRGDAAAHWVSDVQESVPPITSPEYLPALQQICERHEISLLIPLIDPEFSLLAPHSAHFAQLGCKLLVSSLDTCELCLDKRKTAAFFLGAGVSTPRLYTLEETLADTSLPYPLMVKPVDGSSSIGATKANNSEEVRFFSQYVRNALIQEFVSGEEYTLDILLDFAGKALCVVPRLRIETRAGEISKGRTVKNRALMEAGKTLAEALSGGLGAITFQLFLTADQQIKFIEINPRFGGGFPLAAAAGANFPKWIIEMALNKPSSAAFDAWQDGLVMLRYDEAFFFKEPCHF